MTIVSPLIFLLFQLDQASDFESVTTTGKIKFSEYIKGSWTILFLHPADFTSVCTTAVSGFALEKDFFADRETKLVGLSTDSIHSHIAWVNNIKKNTEILFEFPIIADIDMSVSKLLWNAPTRWESAAIRVLFYIDLTGKIRLVMYYPLNVGRNIEEIKRALIALQTADKYKVSMPLNWKLGKRVIVPTPKTVRKMLECEASDYEMVDFYLAKKDLE